VCYLPQRKTMNAREKSALTGTVVLDVRDLQMRYGTKDVLSGVTFTARRGEVLALLGPNGAGKTTTIEILEGFRMRSAGEVSVLRPRPRRRNLASPDRRRAAVVARSRTLARARAARVSRPVLTAPESDATSSRRFDLAAARW
jgi:ABC-type branched-subunit amino acid transport system ATPase component